MAESRTSLVTLEIVDGKLTNVLIDGVEPDIVDQKTRDEIFASPNGPRYVSTIMYAVHPGTQASCIWVHKNCVLVCR